MVAGMGGRATRLAHAALLVAASSAAALLFAEAALRVAAPQKPSWLDVYRRHPALATYALRPGVDAVADTGETRYAVRTDADGFRVGRAPPEGGGAPLVLALGDSYTFGQGVDYEDSYVGRLAARFAGKLRFANAAVGGWGPVQYREELEYRLGAGLAPRAVLVGLYLGNDFHDCVWSKDVPVVDGVAVARESARTWLKRRSHLYRLVAKAYHVLAPAAADEAWHGGSELYREADWEREPLGRAAGVLRDELAAIAAIARERGIALLVVVLPTEASVAAASGRSPAPPGLDLALPARRLEATLASLAIRHVDPTRALAESAEPVYFAFDQHLTPAGHRIVADAAAPWIHALR
jgi:lysophospholipase L1-like esterase